MNGRREDFLRCLVCTWFAFSVKGGESNELDAAFRLHLKMSLHLDAGPASVIC